MISTITEKIKILNAKFKSKPLKQDVFNVLKPINKIKAKFITNGTILIDCILYNSESSQE